MKLTIVLLAPANNIHTIRWANGLSKLGHIIHVISAHSPDPRNQKYYDNINMHILSVKSPLAYIIAGKEVNRLLEKIAPDILNAHYATGYGLLAKLSKFHPLILSIWGSDIYNFPNKSIFHRILLKNNLKNANSIGSTSKIMANHMKNIYNHKHIYITPFGIDVSKFYSIHNKTNPDLKNEIIIGTVKTLDHRYGIDTLIKAFALTVGKTNLNIKLEIVGKGPQKNILVDLVNTLNITSRVIFTDFIAHDQVPAKINSFDIYVALSRQESFGVAILEASACEKAVVVSDADGLKEVVINNKTGIIVAKDSPEEACIALLTLINDESLRSRLGAAGRQHVIENYTWKKSLLIMENAYLSTIERSE